MNTIVTSKEEILKNSRELIREKGWAAGSQHPFCRLGMRGLGWLDLQLL